MTLSHDRGSSGLRFPQPRIRSPLMLGHSDPSEPSGVIPYKGVVYCRQWTLTETPPVFPGTCWPSSLCQVTQVLMTLVRDKGVCERLQDYPGIWKVLCGCLGNPRHHGCSTLIFYQLASFLQSMCLAVLSVDFSWWQVKP